MDTELLEKYGTIIWTIGRTGFPVCELRGNPISDFNDIWSFWDGAKTKNDAIRGLQKQLHAEIWDMVDWLEEIRDEYGGW